MILTLAIVWPRESPCNHLTSMLATRMTASEGLQDFYIVSRSQTSCPTHLIRSFVLFCITHGKPQSSKWMRLDRKPSRRRQRASALNASSLTMAGSDNDRVITQGLAIGMLTRSSFLTV